MKGNDLMSAMNGIDEKYLSESENYAKNNRKPKRSALKVAVSVAAAVVVLAVPVGVYAYNTFVHRGNVEMYMSNAELIEQKSPAAVKNIVAENDDYKITVDSVLSDGNIVMMILTHEALTDKGLEIKEDHVHGCPGACITYADGSEGPFEQSGFDGVPVTGPVTAYAVSNETSVSIFSCKDIDLSKDVNVEFYSSERGWSGTLEYFTKRNDPDHSGDENLVNELDGLEFTTSFAQNVDCVQLQSADGKSISMSSFDVYSSDPSIITVSEDSEFFFITNDGDKKPFSEKKGCSQRSDYGFVTYGEFIDINDYKGVEINGVEYMK